MKTKKLYLFAFAFLFLSVFFVGVDGVRNVAKADYCSDLCGNDDQCLNACYVDEQGGTTSWGNGVTTDVYSGCDPFKDPTCCGDSGGYWYNNSCNVNSDTSDMNMDNAQDANYAKVGGENGTLFISIEKFCTDNGYGFDSQTKKCKDNNWCANTYGTGYVWSSYYGECKGSKGSSCDNSDNCGGGLSCNTEKSVCENNIGGSIADFFGGGSNNDAPQQTPEEIAAAKAAAAKAQLQANTLTAAQNNAVAKANAANAAVQRCTTDCVALQAAANKANEDLLAANAAAEDAIAKYNAAAQTAGLNNGSNGGSSSYMLCANGVLGTVCEGGGGTPITTGMNSSYSGAGGYTGFGGVAGLSGSTQPKCGDGFQDIGGVCFPMTTGLSNAPVTAIIGNIFSWLMMLFTTFAVIAFVVSGIQYFLASGDESMAEKAKENATNAVIGIIVGLSGFIIIKAIAAALSGQSMFF